PHARSSSVPAFDCVCQSLKRNAQAASIACCNKRTISAPIPPRILATDSASPECRARSVSSRSTRCNWALVDERFLASRYWELRDNLRISPPGRHCENRFQQFHLPGEHIAKGRQPSRHKNIAASQTPSLYECRDPIGKSLANLQLGAHSSFQQRFSTLARRRLTKNEVENNLRRSLLPGRSPTDQ